MRSCEKLVVFFGSFLWQRNPTFIDLSGGLTMGAAARISEFLQRRSWLNSPQDNRNEDMLPPFAQIMEMALSIAAKNPAGLQALVHALLRPLQAEHLVAQ